MIDNFEGKYRFLSNFYERRVQIGNLIFDNSEAAYHAEKNPGYAKQFLGLNPFESKRLGRTVPMRKDWDEVKEEIMYKIVKAKFSQNLDLMEQLLATGDEELIEGNTWHDNYWGDCNCPKCSSFKGRNTLGMVLMRVRDEVRKR